jgi:hypothetical protein
MYIRSMICILSTTGVGFAAGAGLGVPLAWFSWGFSIGIGAVVGAVSGFSAGVLAVADASERFGGGGQGVGAGVGTLSVVGPVTYVALSDPGTDSPGAGEWLYLFGSLVFAAGVGFVCGRICERVGRAVADA